MRTTTVTWMTGKGQTMVATAQGMGMYRVEMDGREIVSGAGIVEPKAGPMADALHKAGAVALIPGKGGASVALKLEQRNALRELDAEVTRERKAAYNLEHADELEAGRLHQAVLDAERAITTHGYGNTAARQQTLEVARAALTAWTVQHPAAWATYIESYKESMRDWRSVR